MLLKFGMSHMMHMGKTCILQLTMVPQQRGPPCYAGWAATKWPSAATGLQSLGRRYKWCQEVTSHNAKRCFPSDKLAVLICCCCCCCRDENMLCWRGCFRQGCQTISKVPKHLQASIPRACRQRVSITAHALPCLRMHLSCLLTISPVLTVQIRLRKAFDSSFLCQ
jgi:hypothetical protein